MSRRTWSSSKCGSVLIFVDDLGACYTALGLIHAKYRPP